MLFYWFTIVKIMIARKFQEPVRLDEKIQRSFRVRLFDCDGLRVMTASKYPVYMDFIRWELIARSKLYHAIVKRGLAPTLGSQKIIYRKPLKIWSRFKVTLETVGWDEKWVYHTHTFTQNGQVRAIGITRALIWKRDVPHVLADIIREAGGPEQMQLPPDWVAKMFEDDKGLLKSLEEKTQY